MKLATDRCRVFRWLHESGCFVIPNPWDLGSARLLAQLGFRALATTSSGFAWSVGRPDNGMLPEETLGHLRSIAQGVEVPVNADFERGFANRAGRSEGFIVGRPDLAETIRRLTAYAEAGAECLYAPGIRALSDIESVVKAVAPKPVNVLVGSDFATVAEMADLGVRRISVGGALARAAWAGFLQAAKEIAEQGTFTSLGRAVSFAEINGAFAPVNEH